MKNTFADTIDSTTRHYPYSISHIKSIAIIGLGLVGAYAYRSVIDYFELSGRLDWRVDVFTKTPFTREPKFPGAVFSRFVPKSLNSFSIEPFEIRQYYLGKKINYYSQLLWGKNVKTSVDNLDRKNVKILKGYDPTRVYFRSIEPMRFEQLQFDKINSANELIELCKSYDLVIQTIPDFNVQLPDGRFNFVVEVDPDDGDRDFDNSIIYNATGRSDLNIMCDGMPGVAKGWVRKSVLFDREWIECIEYPLVRSGAKIQRVFKISPDVEPNYKGVASNIMKVGRWATLRKYELAHQAYHDVSYFLKEING